MQQLKNIITQFNVLVFFLSYFCLNAFKDYLNKIKF